MQHHRQERDGLSKKRGIAMELRQRIELTQQTLAALLAVNNNGGKVPDGFVLERQYDNGRWEESFYPLGLNDLAHYRLTPVKQPRRVPLTLADVPPGSAVSANVDHGYCAASADVRGIEFVSECEFFFYTWRELMDRDFKIHRPGGSWQPCWKEVTE